MMLNVYDRLTLMLPTEGNAEIECTISKGVLELYPSLMPKIITLADACVLENQKNEKVEGFAGSMFQLDEAGKVMARIK